MATETTTQTTEGKRKGGRVLRGVVVGSKMQDTITVLVERFVKDPKYKKYQTRTKKYLVHDEGNTAKVGDQVTIVGCAPISKRKTFTLAK